MCSKWGDHHLNYLLYNHIFVVSLLGHVWPFCERIDCSPPGFSIHGIFQGIILEWGAISFSKWSSWPRGRTSNFCQVSALQADSLPLSHWGSTNYIYDLLYIYIWPPLHIYMIGASSIHIYIYTYIHTHTYILLCMNIMVITSQKMIDTQKERKKSKHNSEGGLKSQEKREKKKGEKSTKQSENN